MSLFEYFFKVLSLYLEARIRVHIKGTSRIRIRIKVTSRFRIRINMMQIRNTGGKYKGEVKKVGTGTVIAGVGGEGATLNKTTEKGQRPLLLSPRENIR